MRQKSLQKNMMKYMKNSIPFFIVLLFVSLPVQSFTINNSTDSQSSNNLDVSSTSIMKTFSKAYSFSSPTLEYIDDTYTIQIEGAEHTMVNPGKPVIPFHFETVNLPFGSEVLDVAYEFDMIQFLNITGRIAQGINPQFDLHHLISPSTQPVSIFAGKDLFPSDWISFHTGGGLHFSEHVTFFVLRLYPARYDALNQQIQFIQDINVTITYREPTETLFPSHADYDLLIIAPDAYMNDLNRLVAHKNTVGMKTRSIALSTVYEQMFWSGRDEAEKIKYFIKTAVEEWGITYVLLVGGLHGQTAQWDLPIRSSYVVPPEEQEYAEESFISDLYYADLYDALGDFSSWDSNNDDQFSVWDESFMEEMDLYPDVYLGRLACRNTREVNILIDKIIVYEAEAADDAWFNNLILVAGDSYDDVNGYNEGELIAEEAITLLPDANPVKVYASIDDINRKTVNTAMNQGAGFAYFCGHGSPLSWSTHFPPDGNHWTTGYTVKDMMFLRNKEKLPITVVGGCHNGQFDVTLMNIVLGIREDGLHYFSTNPESFGDFWYNAWVPNCWAWWLTSCKNGGAIATIANTGLGTHGDGDLNVNGIADYLEVLDGWLELRFLELYGIEHQEFLGLNHGQTITEYLQRFHDDFWKMDTKMVQQWELFGDPSLKIAGY